MNITYTLIFQLFYYNYCNESIPTIHLYHTYVSDSIIAQNN